MNFTEPISDTVEVKRLTSLLKSTSFKRPGYEKMFHVPDYKKMLHVNRLPQTKKVFRRKSVPIKLNATKKLENYPQILKGRPKKIRPLRFSRKSKEIKIPNWTQKTTMLETLTKPLTTPVFTNQSYSIRPAKINLPNFQENQQLPIAALNTPHVSEQVAVHYLTHHLIKDHQKLRDKKEKKEKKRHKVKNSFFPQAQAETQNYRPLLLKQKSTGFGKQMTQADRDASNFMFKTGQPVIQKRSVPKPSQDRPAPKRHQGEQDNVTLQAQTNPLSTVEKARTLFARNPKHSTKIGPTPEWDFTEIRPTNHSSVLSFFRAISHRQTEFFNKLNIHYQQSFADDFFTKRSHNKSWTNMTRNDTIKAIPTPNGDCHLPLRVMLHDETTQVLPGTSFPPEFFNLKYNDYLIVWMIINNLHPKLREILRHFLFLNATHTFWHNKSILFSFQEIHIISGSSAQTYGYTLKKYAEYLEWKAPTELILDQVKNYLRTDEDANSSIGTFLLKMAHKSPPLAFTTLRGYAIHLSHFQRPRVTTFLRSRYKKDFFVKSIGSLFSNKTKGASPFSYPEVVKFFDIIENHGDPNWKRHFYGFLWTLIGALRTGESIDNKWRFVDFDDDRVVQILDNKKNNTRNGREQKLCVKRSDLRFCPVNCIKQLALLNPKKPNCDKSPCAFVFPQDSGYQHTNTTINALFKKYIDLMPPEMTKGKKFTVYSLRSTAACLMLAGKRDFGAIQALMRHKCIESTAIYLKKGFEMVRMTSMLDELKLEKLNEYDCEYEKSLTRDFNHNLLQTNLTRIQNAGIIPEYHMGPSY